MKVLILYDQLVSQGILSTQGELLYKGLTELGIEVHAVHYESTCEKEWYYRWLKPNVVVGIGKWQHMPQLVLHPLRHGMQPIPWLILDHTIPKYQEVLNILPLILVTSKYVKDRYVEDGIIEEKIELLPYGCDTDTFKPQHRSDSKIFAVREALNISPDQLMILTVGENAKSNGVEEVMQALTIIWKKTPEWKYVCKTWSISRDSAQNISDLELASNLGIANNVSYTTNSISREFLPYLLGACDIFVAPSKFESFGMPLLEACACEKPVISMETMGFIDTLTDIKTAHIDGSTKNKKKEFLFASDEFRGKLNPKEINISPNKTDNRANVHDLAQYLLKLMNNLNLRVKVGKTVRNHVLEKFDYRILAKDFIGIVNERLGII